MSGNGLPDGLLLRRVEIFDAAFRTLAADVRIARGRVAAVGELAPLTGEPVIEGNDALLLPGLHDHHVHLAATAAAMESVPCGPPQTANETALIARLNDQAGDGWLRGISYHEQVAGDIDRAWLDQHGPDRPIRIQHRTGQLWILNSPALDQLGLDITDGRLFHGDDRLAALRSTPPPVEKVSELLASRGVTGVNDMTVSNDAKAFAWLRSLQHDNRLLQRLRLSGTADLAGLESTPRLQIGETKIYLHDHALPDMEDTVDAIRRSHGQGRAVAFHCVTEAELVFALAALRDAGGQAGDRIEHGAVIPGHLIEQLLELDVVVVTQPNFVAERGDSYLVDVPAQDHDSLYRCATLQRAGVKLAFGTDAPYGNPDPWLAMQAAVDRQTSAGELLGAAECLAPEQALAGFIGDLDAPATPRLVEPGSRADLCMLDCRWADCRQQLSSRHVRMTFRDGELIHG